MGNRRRKRFDPLFTRPVDSYFRGHNNYRQTNQSSSSHTSNSIPRHPSQLRVDEIDEIEEIDVEARMRLAAMVPPHLMKAIRNKKFIDPEAMKYTLSEGFGSQSHLMAPLDNFLNPQMDSLDGKDSNRKCPTSQEITDAILLCQLEISDETEKEKELTVPTPKEKSVDKTNEFHAPSENFKISNFNEVNKREKLNEFISHDNDLKSNKKNAKSFSFCEIANFDKTYPSQNESQIDKLVHLSHDSQTTPEKKSFEANSNSNSASSPPQRNQEENSVNRLISEVMLGKIKWKDVNFSKKVFVSALTDMIAN